jgi:hypothetical protein
MKLIDTVKGQRVTTFRSQASLPFRALVRFQRFVVQCGYVCIIVLKNEGILTGTVKGQGATFFLGTLNI